MKIAISKEVSLDHVQAAAYALTDRAIVYVEETDRGCEVTFLAKDQADEGRLKALEEDFRLVLANQVLRHKLRAGNRAILEYVVPRALVPAMGEAPEESLTPESRRQMERLLAEAEAELASGKPADPLGIARTWEEVHDDVK